MEKIFYTDEDTDLYVRNGAKVKIIREIDSRSANKLDLEEDEKGFVIRFPDGYETEAYESELKENDFKMAVIDKYYDKLKELIDEASKEGVEIRAYTTEIQREEESSVMIDSGIAVGINILNGGNYKSVSTWE